MKKPSRFSQTDILLLIITGGLVLFGTIMVFSSSVIMADIRWQAPYSFFIKQLLWVVLGTAALLFFSQFDYRNIQKLSRLIFFISFLLLVLVLFVGAEKGGRKEMAEAGVFELPAVRICPHSGNNSSR